MLEFGWICLLAAMAGDFAVPYVLAPFYHGYSHKKQVMSVLGNPKSSVRRWYNTWLILLGIGLLASFPALINVYLTKSIGLTITMLTLIAMFAVGAGILSGIFSVNEKKEDQNLASKIHGVASSLGFIALAFAPLFLSILSFWQHETILGILAAVCFALGLVCFVLFVMADKAEFKDTWIENEGLWQRLTLMCMYLPFVIVSIQELIK